METVATDAAIEITGGKMSNRILGWQHERQAKVTTARAMLETAEGEQRDLTGDEENRYNDLLDEAGKIETKIERERKLQALESEQELPMRRAAKPVPMGRLGDAMIGMNEGEVRQYSLVRAINAHLTGDWRNARMEWEAHEATQKRLGYEAQGFFVPYDWVSGGEKGQQQRDLLKGTPTAGGHTVATNLLAQNFIDLLSNKMVLQQAGITVLDGLVGDIAIPRQTASSTAYWVAENGAPTESQPAFDQIGMNPKTMGGFVDISRKLLKQSSLSIEGFVRNDLARVMGLEGDRVGLHGSGASNQPLGVAGMVGIGAVVGGTNGLAPTWAHIVGLETEVAIDNADMGALRYITNAKVRGKLKTTPRVAGTNDNMVWPDNTTPLNGYPALVSNQVASNLTKGASTGVCSAAFFGNWADLIMAMWGGLDVLIDPYTNGTTGAVRVINLQDMDFAGRHPESFSLMADVLTI